MAKGKNLSAGRILYSLMFLALAVLLPLVEGQIGFSLGFMGLFTLLCGFMCGATWGMIVGALTPFLHSMVFAGKIFFASDLVLAISLAAGAFVGGLLFKKLDKNMLFYFVAVIAAVICSALAQGAVTIIFTFLNWISGDVSINIFLNCLTADFYVKLIHVIAVPLIVSVFRKNRLILN